MKTTLKAAIAALGGIAVSGAASAHELGGAHMHPHVDPTVIMAALVATGVAVWAWSARK